MPVKSTLGWIFNPKQQWQAMSHWQANQYNRFLLYPIVLALLPAIAWYVGLTDIGWKVGGGETVRLTVDSATRIVALFYIALLMCIGVIGYLIHWMSSTYGCDTTVSKGIAITGFTATPLFLFGVLGFYPVFWLDFLIGLVCLCWSVYLLYIGIPIAMNIPEERGFLYASAIVAVCLVVFMALMGASVILWDFGAAPVFTN